jgi:hypothetical protein
MPATAYTANLIAKAAAHGSAYQGPATIYLALVTTTPSATVPGTEVDDDDYVRVALTQATDWDDDDAGTLTNNLVIDWAEAHDDFSADVEAIEAYDADTSGNRLWYQLLSAPVTYLAGDIPSLEEGALTYSVV